MRFREQSIGQKKLLLSLCCSAGEPILPALTPTGATLAVVSEDAPPKTFVAHLSVTDPDSGLNGRVNCSLIAGVGSSSPGSASTAFALVRKYATEYQVRREESHIVSKV